MPANLPPTYHEAERRYREAKTQQEKIDALEEMLAIIPKHKGTDKLQAHLKRRPAMHRDESQKKKGAEAPPEVRRPLFHKKMILLANKMESRREEEDFEALIELTSPEIPALGISVSREKNLREFLEAVFRVFGVIRVYSKNPGREPDLDEPFVVPVNSTLGDLASKIHRDFLTRLKYARVWGAAVHDGQMVQRDYVHNDGNIVEIHV